MPDVGGERPALDPIITMNAGGIIQSASDSVEQIFGWTPSELYGMNVKMLIPEPRRSALDRYLDRYRRADQSKSLERTRRFDAIRKNGTSLQIDLTMSRAELPQSTAPYFIGIVRDVSNQIDVAEETAEQRSRLQQLVTEQTRALATAHLRLQLSDRMTSIGTLAAGLGHDMNNVLLPVRARLNAIEHTGIGAEAMEHIVALRRSIAYLQHLSDGLHSLAIDPEDPGPDNELGVSTSLATWWSQIGPLLRNAVPKRFTFVSNVPASLPEVAVPPHWLTQAMLNVIVNAGEAITKTRAKPRITLSATVSDDGAVVRLSVTDNGRGMSRDVQKRAFDLFFTTKSRGLGTGLGLPLSRKVLQRAGGTIELTSKAGVGTSVVLVLPVAKRKKSRRQAQDLDLRESVISVSDHRFIALLSQLLTAAGFNVKRSRGNRPGRSDLWVTTPSRETLRAAELWQVAHRSRHVILLGVPSKAMQPRWLKLGATVIEPPVDFEAARHAVSVAKERLSQRAEPEATR